MRIFSIILALFFMNAAFGNITDNSGNSHVAANQNSAELSTATNLVKKTEFGRYVFHLDLRIQVVTFPKLLELVDYLAEKGFDSLIIEWEGSFPYNKHATVSNRYAYSREEVARLIEYAGERSIDIIPLQQCFGHVEYILRHDRYTAIREDQKELGQVCPCKSEEALVVFREMMEDVIKLHPSPYFHIGGDETWLLGHCPNCAKVVQEKGLSFLYAKYLKEILDLVQSLGKIPLLWADIILKYPEYASILPKDAVFIDWNYGWAFDKFGDNTKLLEQGFTFWGAPSIRSHPDNFWLTCWNKHLNNYRDFVSYSRKSGYEGIILTSWSTSGGYDYYYDPKSHVAEMFPIRRVYPQAGSKLLIEAFTEAAHGEEDFVPDLFLNKYGTGNFGLSQSDAEQFSRILRRPRVHLAEKRITDEEAEVSRKDFLLLQGFSVTNNQTEWDHLLLMTQLEAHQLQVMLLEDRVQSDSFSRSGMPVLKKTLRTLCTEADAIDKEFSRLNSEYFDPHELEAEIKYRRHRLDDLLARMSR